MSYLHRFKAASQKIREGMAGLIPDGEAHFTLLYIAAGKGVLRCSSREISITEGNVILLDEEGVLIGTSTELFTVYTLSWSKEDKDLVPISSMRLADHPPADIVPLWEEVMRLQMRESFSDLCHFQSVVWRLLSLLSETRTEDQFEEILEKIKEDPSYPYTVATLAEKAKMNPASFTRTFKKRTGMSPKEFLIQERMRAAKRLMLQNRGITAKDVALKIGIQDEFYFSRLFKQKAGLSPTVYMKRSSERIAVVSQLFLQDHLLALGIQPVAAPSYPSVYPATKGVPYYLAGEMEGTRLLNAERLFYPEEILQTNPDRILKTPLHNGEIQSILLSHHQMVQHIPLKTEWNSYLREIGRIVGKESLVDGIEQEMDLLESRVRDELIPMTRRGNWAVIWIRQEEIRLYGHRNHACLDLLFGKLGFEPHPDLPDNVYQIVTIEELAALECDKLLILWSNEQDVWRVIQTKEWKAIKAVESKEVYFPKSHEWDPWGPLGRKHMLNQLAPTLQHAKLQT